MAFALIIQEILKRRGEARQRGRMLIDSAQSQFGAGANSALGIMQSSMQQMQEANARRSAEIGAQQAKIFNTEKSNAYVMDLIDTTAQNTAQAKDPQTSATSTTPQVGSDIPTQSNSPLQSDSSGGGAMAILAALSKNSSKKQSSPLGSLFKAALGIPDMSALSGAMSMMGSMGNMGGMGGAGGDGGESGGGLLDMFGGGGGEGGAAGGIGGF